MDGLRVTDEQNVSGELIRRHPRALVTLFVLLLLTILSYVDRMALVLLVDPIKQDLGLSDVQISLLQGTAFALCFSLASPPLGWLADRVSRRWLIYCGVTLWSLATAASGLATSFGMLFAARFLVGIGEAALAPAAYSMLSELFPRRELALATGLLAGGAAIGGGAAVMLGGLLGAVFEQSGAQTLPLVGIMQPWQMVFICLGLPGLLITLGIFLAPETRARKAVQQQAEGFATWAKGNAAYLIGVAIGTSGLGIMAYAVTYWTPAYLTRVLNLDLAALGGSLGTVQTIAGFCGYVGSGFLIGWMTKRGHLNSGYRYLIGASVICTLASVVGFLLTSSLLPLLLCIGLFHLAVPFTAAVMCSLQANTPAEYRGRVIGLVSTVYTLIGLTAGPSCVALLTEKLFADPESVGRSIAITCLIAGPIGVAAYAATWRASKRAELAVRGR